MPIEIKVPAVGESVTEGSIARWLKKDGASVQTDEPLFELETEKATQAVPAPASGVLHITIAEGKTVAIGSVVGTIDPAGATAPAPPAAPAKPSDTKPAGSNAAVSPAARRLATEEQVDVKQLAGTGRGGVILKNDVQDHLDKHQTSKPELPPVVPSSQPPPSAEPAPQIGRETRQRMSAIRQRIAERLLAAQKQTASLTTFNEADMAPIMDLRTRYKDKFKEKHDVGLGFMAFFVKAAVAALKAHPLVNAAHRGCRHRFAQLL